MRISPIRGVMSLLCAYPRTLIGRILIRTLLELFGPLWPLYAQTAKANPLLTYGKDWLSMSHTLTSYPPWLPTAMDESNNG